MKKKLYVLLIATFTIGEMLAQENATIYFRRPFQYMGSALAHFIEINDVPICNIGSGGCFKLTIPAGNIMVKDYVGLSSFEKMKTKNQCIFTMFSVQAGETYYVKIEEAAGKIVIEENTKASKYKAGSQLDFAILQEQNPILQSGDSQKTQNNKSLQQPQIAQTTTTPQPPTHNQPTSTIIQPQQKTQLDRNLCDVDNNIPITNTTSEDIYVLIIANEDYLFLDNVNFASYDGEIFKEYCIKTLGIPERQIRYCPNATYGILSGGVDWLSYALNNFDGSRAIVYYCGHGIPDEKTNEAYIIPVDGKGTNTATCYSLNTLYKTLAETKAANVTYFMDACFTGANKEGNMLVAARGVAREAKKETISGRSVVFSASSGDETAMTYEEKQHGLFTYYLLKRLQETEGNVTYEDLASYISKNVKKDAFLLNEKPQTPVVATSPAAASIWKTMKLK